jgi:hypothetical protein
LARRRGFGYRSGVEETVPAMMERVRELVDEYRSRCLWFLRKDFYPATPEEACRTLEQIERHGDLAAFKKAAPLRQWLSQHSSAKSAA